MQLPVQMLTDMAGDASRDDSYAQGAGIGTETAIKQTTGPGQTPDAGVGEAAQGHCGSAPPLLSVTIP